MNKMYMPIFGGPRPLVALNSLKVIDIDAAQTLITISSNIGRLTGTAEFPISRHILGYDVESIYPIYTPILQQMWRVKFPDGSSFNVFNLKREPANVLRKSDIIYFGDHLTVLSLTISDEETGATHKRVFQLKLAAAEYEELRAILPNTDFVDFVAGNLLIGRFKFDLSLSEAAEYKITNRKEVLI